MEQATKFDVVNIKLGWARINVIKDTAIARHSSIEREGCAIQTPFGLPVKKNILINRI
jgi:riboflavin synthase